MSLIRYEDLPEELRSYLDASEEERHETCEMEDCGDYMPHHMFKRMRCLACGGMHWEQPQRTLPRMRHCPWCGAKVTGWRERR